MKLKTGSIYLISFNKHPICRHTPRHVKTKQNKGVNDDFIIPNDQPSFFFFFFFWGGGGGGLSIARILFTAFIFLMLYPDEMSGHFTPISFLSRLSCKILANLGHRACFLYDSLVGASRMFETRSTQFL